FDRIPNSTDQSYAAQEITAILNLGSSILTGAGPVQPGSGEQLFADSVNMLTASVLVGFASWAEGPGAPFAPAITSAYNTATQQVATDLASGAYTSTQESQIMNGAVDFAAEHMAPILGGIQNVLGH